MRGTQQFLSLPHLGVPVTEPAGYMTAGVCSAAEFMVRADEGSLAPAFLPYSPFSDALNPPQGAHPDYHRPRG